LRQPQRAQNAEPQLFFCRNSCFVQIAAVATQSKKAKIKRPAADATQKNPGKLVPINLGFDEMVLGIDAPNKPRIAGAEGSEAPSGNLSVLPVGRV